MSESPENLRASQIKTRGYRCGSTGSRKGLNQLLPGVTVSPRAYPTVLFDGNHLLVFGGLGRLRAGSAYQQSDYKADLHRLTFVLCEDEGQTD